MAAATLLGFCLRNQVEKLIDYKLLKTAAPTPVPDDPTYEPSRDVSVVVPTIDTSDNFVDSLESWLAADPLEIIIVTTPDQVFRVQSLLRSVKATDLIDLTKRVTIHFVKDANKRQQMAKGAEKARGRIICFADDDVIWPSPRFLKSILACFENPKVGAAGGRQRPHVPADRRDPAVITPWEVAGVRRLSGDNGDQAAVQALEGDSFVLTGRTALYRVEIVRDDTRFTAAFLNDTWGLDILGFAPPRPLNSGDDVFCTRWVQDHGWEVAVQADDDAVLLAHIHRDARFASQMVRWWRNTMRAHLRAVFVNGRVWDDWRALRKITLDFLFRPLITCLFLYAWVSSLFEAPKITFFVTLIYIFDILLDLARFLIQHPYCAHHFWAVILADYSYLVLDVYAWFTLGDLGWLTRETPSAEECWDKLVDEIEGYAERETNL
ncbi:hypothetical protein GGTG_03264 [Gaeumannomyces tritici R3-111a-1]|uniref:Polysaccharide synthase Cps1p n=1 Tax=Gaeumannomyces tritici (strain R3-111a-1) TaxID=644352 RepID=J3NPQ7_GAET3|nr:hypothetical protein GGTG_03264 [Gaeumannomyces tritici R3-111a-1]EJT78162.1 hypothetical protein GGTG_03264 [Gaeumannomyces tritici R3-111a-1]